VHQAVAAPCTDRAGVSFGVSRPFLYLEARCYSRPRTSRYNPQTIARAPTTASTATTQKNIASMHSPLWAAGYNKVVTHGRGACNCLVVAF
jgi:hypothetical protein